jgi:hypothetical protein
MPTLSSTFKALIHKGLADERLTDPSWYKEHNVDPWDVLVDWAAFSHFHAKPGYMSAHDAYLTHLARTGQFKMKIAPEDVVKDEDDAERRNEAIRELSDKIIKDRPLTSEERRIEPYPMAIDFEEEDEAIVQPYDIRCCILIKDLIFQRAFNDKRWYDLHKIRMSDIQESPFYFGHFRLNPYFVNEWYDALYKRLYTMLF